MPDKNFEHKISEILGKMEMQPADEVWINVKKTLPRAERKRRSILWLPLLLSAVVGSAILYDNINRETEKNREHSAKNISNHQKAPLAPSRENPYSENNKAVAKNTLNAYSGKKTSARFHSYQRSEKSEKVFTKEADEMADNRFAESLKKSTEVPLKKQSIEAGYDSSAKDSFNPTPQPKDSSVKNVEVQQPKPEIKTSASSVLSEKKSEKKWKFGLAIAGGTASYASGSGLFGAANGQVNAASSPISNPSPSAITNERQHARKGTHIGASVFAELHKGHFVFRAGLGIEFLQFENYQTTIMQTTGVSVTGITYTTTSISGSFVKRYSYVGVSVPLSVGGSLICNQEHGLYWQLGLPQQFYVNRSAESSTNSPFAFGSIARKKIVYIPSVEPGFHYQRKKGIPLGVTLYMNVGLNTLRAATSEPVHLYKAGLRINYYLK